MTRAPSASAEPKAFRRSGGFTLIELLLVIALMGLVGIFALPKVSSIFKVSLNSSTRDMATTIREAYNATLMTKRVHRLVYDFKEQAYWVEMGPPVFLLETEQSRERSKRLRKAGSKAVEEEEEKKNADFILQKNVTRKHMPLPRGVELEDVMTEQTGEPITEGRAYTHFFPHGLIEQSLIHLKDNSGHKATLVVPPLVGRSKVFPRYVTREEAFEGEVIQ